MSNIFRYEIETRQLEAVSNTETGFFRPVPLADGRLLVFRYTGQGFVPAWIDPTPVKDINPITFLGERLVEECPAVKSWMLDSPAKVPFDTMEKETGGYGLGGGLRRESIYPVVEGLQLELELSVEAKAMVMAREAGLEVPVTEDLRASLQEIAHLESSIGRPGLLALQPLNVVSDRDRWHRYLLDRR